MKIENAIKQTKPMVPQQKAFINLIYTYNWFLENSNQMFKPYQVTAQQYNVLRILKGSHPQPMMVGDVKSVMLDKNPDLTRLCDRLIEKGLIERIINCNNRRTMLLSITQKGIDFIEYMEPNKQGVYEAMKHLSEEEYLQLSDLLDKMRGD